MVLLNIPALCGYAFIILMLVNDTKGKNIVERLLDYINRCPESEGYFFAPGTGESQCLKAFVNDYRRPWSEAKELCCSEGLELARPYNAQALAKYLFERYNRWNFWVDARGEGTHMKWQTDRDGGEDITNKSPLWWPNEPRDLVSFVYCMELITNPMAMKINPGKPYSSDSCMDAKWTLCEKRYDNQPELDAGDIFKNTVLKK